MSTVETSLRTLTQLWRGDVSWSRAMLNGSVTVHGAAETRGAVPHWLGRSSLAAIPRPA